MDWVLLGFCLIYFLVGIKKGFVSTIFSLLSTAIVVLLSFRFCENFSTIFRGLCGDTIDNVLKNGINGIIPGEYESSESLLFCLVSTKYGKYFGTILKYLLKNVQFEGPLTAGEIMAPVFSRHILKVIAFALLFLILSLFAKILEKILKKICKFFGWKGNRLVGGVLGISKGVAIFMVCFVVITAVANFTLSEPLINFVQSGVITKQIYNNVAIKIISLFY